MQIITKSKKYFTKYSLHGIYLSCSLYHSLNYPMEVRISRVVLSRQLAATRNRPPQVLSQYWGYIVRVYVRTCCHLEDTLSAKCCEIFVYFMLLLPDKYYKSSLNRSFQYKSNSLAPHELYLVKIKSYVVVNSRGSLFVSTTKYDNVYKIL